MEVIPTKWGIACRIGKKIYINYSISKDSKFYKALVKHEKAHTEGFTMGDVLLDAQGRYLKEVKRDYYRFILSNPRALAMFVPIWKYGKTWTIDWTMFAIWVFVLSCVGGTLYFLV